MHDEKPIQIRLLQEKTENWPSNRSVISALTDQSATAGLSSVSCSDLGDGVVAVAPSFEDHDANVFNDDGKSIQFQPKEEVVAPSTAHKYQPELGGRDYVNRTMTQFRSVLKVPMNEGGKAKGGITKPKVTNTSSIFRTSILDNLLFPVSSTAENVSHATSTIPAPPPPPPLSAPPQSTTTKASPSVTFSNLQSTTSSKAKTTTMTSEQNGLRDMESGSVVSGGSSFQFVSVQNLF